MTTARRKAKLYQAAKGEVLNEAVFDIDPKDIYVRFTVIDAEGFPAQTNAYFTDELFAEETAKA